MFQICSHAYLIHSDSDNLREILKRVESLAGLNPIRVFHSNPKILSCALKNIEKIDKLLKVSSRCDIAHNCHLQN